MGTCGEWILCVAAAVSLGIDVHKKIKWQPICISLEYSVIGSGPWLKYFCFRTTISHFHHCNVIWVYVTWLDACFESFTLNTCYVSNLVAICSCCTKRISSIKFISTISILFPGIDTKIEVRVAPPVTLERHEWRPRPLWPKNPCPWWRHQMEIFSTLLALCEWIHRSPVNSPHKGEWRGVWCFLLSLHE